jgi:hypothetical protein
MHADRIRRALREHFGTDIKQVSLVLLDPSPDGGTPGEDEQQRWNYDSKGDMDNHTKLAQGIFDCAQSLTDEMARAQTFMICGYNKDGKRVKKTRIKQTPDREIQALEPSAEGQIAQSMRHMENAYRMVSEVQEKHAAMVTDFLDSFHKRLKDVENREMMQAEIIRGYRDLNVDFEEKSRREERYTQLFTVLAETLTPALAEKFMLSGMISPETAAGLSATGKQMAEDIKAETQGPTGPTNGTGTSNGNGDAH